MITTEIEKKIDQWVEGNKEVILNFVSDLVRFNTVNEIITGNEKECQYYISNVLMQMGLTVDLYSPEEVKGFREHPAYFPGKDYANRPNVIGIWEGKGRGKSLVFSSHSDTTVAGWKKDPWTPLIENGRLYGLGTFDMKGGLTASIMAVRCLRELGVELTGDVFIESVVDEEFGGANGTLAGRLRGYNPDAAIIPEPTNLAVCPAARGGALWRVTFTGNTGMSYSEEKIINPANLAAKFIVWLEEYESERGKKQGSAPWYENDSILPVIITRVEAGDMKALLCDSGPMQCHVDIWVECHPGVTEDHLKQEIMGGFSRKYGQEIPLPEMIKMIRFLPGTEIDPDFPLIGILANETKIVTGKDALTQGAPFACDAFMFNLYSPTPAIIMGPVGANAHAPDEYIEIGAFLDLVKIYARTMIVWCGLFKEGEAYL
jgi:acetylornithine deacetylase